jgi:5-methylcytosine-specific restriction endonuclease McrA
MCKELLPSTFQVDHHMPLAVGGSNEVHNLTAMCPACHADKTQEEHVRVDAYRDIMKRLKGTSGSACWHCGVVFSTYFKHKCSADNKIT